MAYTSTDLTNVQTAIASFADGTRKGSVQINGKRVDYAQTTLAELTNLRDQIQSEVSASAGRRRFVLVSTSKGL